MSFENISNDELRGHSLYPTEEEVREWPALYATDGEREKRIIARYFTNAGAALWLLAEYDPQDRIAFGWCDLGVGGAELGYFSLLELSDLRVVKNGFPIIVERDLHFTPSLLSECKK